MSPAENATMSLTSPFKERFNLIASSARDGRQSEVWERVRPLEERDRKKADDLGVGIPRFELPVRFTVTNDSGEIHSFFLCLLDFACTQFVSTLHYAWKQSIFVDMCWQYVLYVHKPIYLPCFLITIRRHVLCMKDKTRLNR